MKASCFLLHQGRFFRIELVKNDIMEKHQDRFCWSILIFFGTPP